MRDGANYLGRTPHTRHLSPGAARGPRRGTECGPRRGRWVRPPPRAGCGPRRGAACGLRRGVSAARGGRYLGSRQGLGAACSRCSGPFTGLLPVSVVRYWRVAFRYGHIAVPERHAPVPVTPAAVEAPGAPVRPTTPGPALAHPSAPPYRAPPCPFALPCRAQPCQRPSSPRRAPPPRTTASSSALGGDVRPPSTCDPGARGNLPARPGRGVRTAHEAVPRRRGRRRGLVTVPGEDSESQ